MASDPKHGLFVGSAVDDAGLDPYEFRVLCRIARRGNCTESLANMARGTKMGGNRCREAIKALVGRGLVRREDVLGVGMKLTADPSRIREGLRISEGTPNGSGRRPLTDQVGKGIPSKVLPKGLERSSENKLRKTKKAERSEQANAIYQAYPRKRNRAAALKAICKALERESFEMLMQRTNAFGVARSSEDSQFTPYPATWFNAEGYHDEPDAPSKPKRPQL